MEKPKKPQPKHQIYAIVYYEKNGKFNLDKKGRPVWNSELTYSKVQEIRKLIPSKVEDFTLHNDSFYDDHELSVSYVVDNPFYEQDLKTWEQDMVKYEEYLKEKKKKSPEEKKKEKLKRKIQDLENQLISLKSEL